jgi:pteridine reductase
VTGKSIVQKNILITGAGKRVGAACARVLHNEGCNIVIHYRSSMNDAKLLNEQLNQKRPGSAKLLQADLLNDEALKSLAEDAVLAWGGIDVLVNNASAFYATPMAEVTERQWHELLGSNLKAPFFLAKYLASSLKERNGCIVNITDIHAERGLKSYPVYSIAKAGLVATTKILAKELAPEIRVNAVAPGAILWPENDLPETEKAKILERVALQRQGSSADIAKAVSFLIQSADYITGQIISVDGGRTLFC